MTTIRRLMALAVLGLAACSAQPSVGSRLNGPTAAVAFRGFSRKGALIQDYVAVASSRGDELRFLDPADLQPVLSPGAVFPLSIPTAPRPLLLASAALRDVDAADNRLDLADVLVAASAGGAGTEGSGPSLQLIETWDATSRVAQDVPLAGVLAAGSEILCLAGMPARGLTSPFGSANARILVGASGGQLAVVEFTRATDGSGAVVPGTPVVKSLVFDPIDIAASPDGAAIYIATRDPIATDATLGAVFGVAKVDASGDIVAGAVTALAAGPQDPDSITPGPPRIGAGTIAVAVPPAAVPERSVDSSVGTSVDQLVTVTPTPFVYAGLDPDSCGNTKPINCGVVTIDPNSTLNPGAGNLATDRADPLANTALFPDLGPPATVAVAQPYRAPMPVPGVPLHIAIGVPPASGSQRLANDPLPGTALFALAPVAGTRNTGAVAMISSSIGNVYWLDLSRFSPPSDLSVARGSTRVSVTTVTPAAAAAAGENQLGLWQDTDNQPFGSTLAVAQVNVDAAGLASAIDVWPGFTDADTWTLAYQGALPFLSSRPGLLITSTAGTPYVALQTGTSAGAVVLTTPIADPSLGVLPGDIVELPGVCEASVAAVLAVVSDPNLSAGVSFPRGALQLNVPGSPGVTCTADQLLAAGPPSVPTITVRASGMVLSNTKLGHLGRPAIARTTDSTENAFSVAWNAGDLGAASTTDALVARSLARKARRLFYPSDAPCPIASPANAEEASSPGCYSTGLRRLRDPLAPGPIIRFRVGLGGNPPAPAVPPRDASIVFVTQAGLSQTFRKPVTGGAGAGAAIFFDRTALDPTGKTKLQFAGHENDPIFFFVPYLDDQVMAFSPTQSSAQVSSIR